ncbi:trimeric LpxA-like protein [Aureobasidium pullulans]|uniref:Trimeric LpxA-like protein n=1 Tax=Aureobasidium pullulans TaxID=5580 RepID=A0A4V4LDP5_AURPU|nr:trimeric LpxA-like protein [Aureobasidium pullulans]
MAAVKQPFEADASVTVNGNKGILNHSQNTSFRPGPSAFSTLSRPHTLPKLASGPEWKHKPLLAGTEGSRGSKHDDSLSRSVDKPFDDEKKRKRSVEAILDVSPRLSSRSARRKEVFEYPINLKSTAKNLPPFSQICGSEQHHAADQPPCWRQHRYNPSPTELQADNAVRRESHMHPTRDDRHDGSGNPQPETGMQSDQESGMQNASVSQGQGSAQRRRFSQRTKTGCYTCRHRKKKCDEGKPHCGNCVRGGFLCQGYGPKHKLDVKLPAKPVPLQPRTVDVYAYSGQAQSRSPGPAAKAQEILSYDERTHEHMQLLGDIDIYHAATENPRPIALPGYEAHFSSDRLARPSQSEKACVLPSPSRFSVSAPSIMTETNGGSLGHLRCDGSTSLDSTFDTPSAALTNRLSPNPSLGASPFSGPSEKEKMLSGRGYRQFTDPELLNDREWCKAAIERYNKASKPSFDIDVDERMRLFRQILRPDRLLQLVDSHNHPIGTIGSKILIEAPFDCLYGYNIHIADNVVIQAGCIMQDPCSITIGRNSIIGPNVKFYGLGPDTRRYAGVQTNGERNLRGGKITVAEDCFIGGDVVIFPNVIIGRECVVEPGTVVSSNIEPGNVVAGNPMRVTGDLNRDDGYIRTEPMTSWSIRPAERPRDREGRTGM